MDGRDARRRARPDDVPAGSLALGAARLAWFGLVTLLFIPAVLVAALGDRDGRRAYRLARWWAWLNVRTCGVRIDADGLAQLDPRASYVFMANHRSAFDVLTLVVVLWEFQLRWVAKAELGRIPGFGTCLRATKQIFVERGDHASAVASLAAARERIQGGISAVFFPEGTRGDGGPMLPFKKGGFVFAIETATPIVPIAVVGSHDLLARTSVLCRFGSRLRVVVRPPIATAGLMLADRDALLGRVRRSIATIVDAPAARAPGRAGAHERSGLLGRARSTIRVAPRPRPARPQ